MQISGFVTYVGQNGGHPHSFAVKGTEGFLLWDKKENPAPPFKKGDNIEIEIKEREGKNIAVKDTLVVKEDTGGSKNKGGWNKGGSGKSGDWPTAAERATTQRSIQIQSATKDAIAMMDVALKHEAVKLPAKVADKFDAMVAMVRKLAEEQADIYAESAKGTAPNKADDTKDTSDPFEDTPSENEEKKPEDDMFDD